MTAIIAIGERNQDHVLMKNGIRGTIGVIGTAIAIREKGKEDKAIINHTHRNRMSRLSKN